MAMTYKNMSILCFFIMGCSSEPPLENHGGGGSGGRNNFCEQDADCANDENHFCEENYCEDGSCKIRYKKYGTYVPQEFQKKGDCKEIFCSGNPENFGEMEVINDLDRDFDGNLCTQNLCKDGNLSFQNEGEGRICQQESGDQGRCDGKGLCAPWIPIRCKIDNTDQIFQCPEENNVADIIYNMIPGNITVTCRDNIPENNQYCPIAQACTVILPEGKILSGHCL